MFKNIALVFVLVCLVQTIRCDEIDDLIKELQPQVDALRKTVRGQVDTARVFVDGGHDIIHDIIASGNYKVNAEIHKLRVAAKSAQEEAEAAGKNITKCIEDEETAIRNIDRKAFAICREENIINSATPVLSQLSQLETDVVLIPTKCRNGVDITVDKVRTCIEGNIVTLRNTGATLLKLVEDIMMSAEQESYYCAQDASKQLVATTSAIGTIFSTCVKTV